MPKLIEENGKRSRIYREFKIKGLRYECEYNGSQWVAFQYMFIRNIESMCRIDNFCSLAPEYITDTKLIKRIKETVTDLYLNQDSYDG